jgi:hypothetical protein
MLRHSQNHRQVPLCVPQGALFVSSLLLLVGGGTDESTPAMAAEGEASTPKSTLPRFSISQNVQDNRLFEMLVAQAPRSFRC